MPKKYIDAEKLREMMDDQYPFDKGTQSRHDAFNVAKSAMIKLLYDAPIVDVVERKKGKWICYGFTLHKCSLCGFEDASCEPNNFCANCGADMREE